MDSQQWKAKYRRMREIVERIYASRRQQAVSILREAGLSDESGRIDMCVLHNIKVTPLGTGGWGGRIGDPESMRTARIHRHAALRALALLDDYSPSRVVDRWVKRTR